jgi:CheY-like chemotaxis protein
MGGDLRLLPPEAPGSGAGFELTIRLDTPTGEAVAPVPPRRLDGCRVLVVDDIATNTFVAAAHLRALGAEVVTAEGGTAALQRLDETPVDLVLLDMNMPPPDGMATFRAIRARGLPVKVVAMTAAASDAERTGFLAAGIDGFLPKPISSATLAHVLAETGIGRPARP